MVRFFFINKVNNYNTHEKKNTNTIMLNSVFTLNSLCSPFVFEGVAMASAATRP